MKIGCCVSMLPDGSALAGGTWADAAAAAGFDYIDLPLGALALLSDPDFEQLRRKLGDAGIPARASNAIFARDIKLFADGGAGGGICGRIRRSVERAARLGIGMIGFGGPEARTCPPGLPREAALERLVRWCRVIGEEAAGYGIGVALEPLCREECNLVNTYAEAAEIVSLCGLPNVGLLQDYYHMRMENDVPETMLRFDRKLLRHVHIARISDRGYPAEAAEDPGYADFFRVLREMGYGGGISIEAKMSEREHFPEKAERALKLIRRLAEG